jgi:hypothetical protein
MRKNLLWAPLLPLSVLVAALVYGQPFFRCHITAASSVVASDTGNSECCRTEDSECCQPESRSSTPKGAGSSIAQHADPARQIVFKVEGLRCPAVKGIGCGHMLAPVLERLDETEGVEASFANYTGTMIRISVKTGADRSRVAERVRKALTDDDGKPVALAGDEFKRALEREQWRDVRRIGELSAIEFHTLALHRVKTFAKAEKLDEESTDKLIKITEEYWESMTKEAQKDGAIQPKDLGNRLKKTLPAFLERLKEVLTNEQVERLKQTLTCSTADQPEAPPADGEKHR